MTCRSVSGHVIGNSPGAMSQMGQNEPGSLAAGAAGLSPSPDDWRQHQSPLITAGSVANVL